MNRPCPPPFCCWRGGRLRGRAHFKRERAARAPQREPASCAPTGAPPSQNQPPARPNPPQVSLGWLLCEPRERARTHYPSSPCDPFCCLVNECRQQRDRLQKGGVLRACAQVSASAGATRDVATARMGAHAAHLAQASPAAVTLLNNLICECKHIRNMAGSKLGVNCDALTTVPGSDLLVAACSQMIGQSWTGDVRIISGSDGAVKGMWGVRAGVPAIACLPQPDEFTGESI